MRSSVASSVHTTRARHSAPETRLRPLLLGCMTSLDCDGGDMGLAPAATTARAVAKCGIARTASCPELLEKRLLIPLALRSSVAISERALRPTGGFGRDTCRVAVFGFPPFLSRVWC